MPKYAWSISCLAVGLVVVGLHTTSVGVEIKSKAAEINLTGRVHTQFNTTSAEGALGSEFLIRRARITAEVKINDFVSGKVQPDFGAGKLSLKDAYTKFTFGSQFKVYTGQFKRPFDLFGLASSTEMLVVERSGKVRGVSDFSSYSSLTEGLDYTDRDIGVKASFQSVDKAFGFDVAVTNADGSGKIPSTDSVSVSEKQYTARAVVKPAMDRPLALAAGFTALPVAQSVALAAGDPAPDVEYATAFEISAELGDFKEGLHVQAGAVFGDNWKLNAADPPSFMAVQAIVTFKHPVADNDKVIAFEPILRISYADPNTDTDDDAGILITPGIQVFFIGRNKISLNVDVFSPQDSDKDTEYSIKAQTYLYF